MGFVALLITGLRRITPPPRITHSQDESSAEGTSTLPPLAVDLDSTLLKTDLLIESVLALLKKRPSYLFILPLWIARGKAWFKQQVARRVTLDVSTLPWQTQFLDYLRQQRAEGRSLVLASTSDMRVARQIADHLGLFETVLAGESKRDLLVSRFEERGFDYAAAGSGRRDLKVWGSARKAIVVNPNVPGLLERLKPLRPAHWLKNLLVFAPLLAAHRFQEIALLEKSLLAFVAFGCCASSGYFLNDLVDLEADRHHPQKRFRPFAAGDLPLSYALTMIPVLLALGCYFGMLVSLPLLAILALYFALSAGYSMHIKHVAVLDVLFLAGLYTMRIMAGSAATGLWPSHLLLAFSIFLFFSLALVKRYSELVIMRQVDGSEAKARGYELSDGELLSTMGTASGYLAVLVLALYIATDKAQALYSSRELLWFLCPLLLYWISYLWLTAHRGKMPGDPVVFALGDRTSRILIFLMLVTAAAAL